MREASERFRSLVELSNDWFWEQDESLRFTRIEAQELAEAWHWANLQEFIGRRRWDFPVVNMTPADWEAHRRLLHEHRMFHDLELISRDDAGELMHMLVSGAPRIRRRRSTFAAIAAPRVMSRMHGARSTKRNG